ncbi:MAG TPA: hypothetical protein VK625_17345, partial [Flavitalea sp.]|nr:hypothetical protein [Flavitalea sp.]
MNKRLVALFSFMAFRLVSFSQTDYPVTGKIIDQNDKPVRKAVLSVLNTNIQAVTDTGGNFYFSG